MIAFDDVILRTAKAVRGSDRQSELRVLSKRMPRLHATLAVSSAAPKLPAFVGSLVRLSPSSG